MKALIDTNILVSAALFPHSVPAQAFVKAVSLPGKAMVCDYSMDELRRVFNEKFPHRIADYERFMAIMALSVTIVFTPPEEERHETEKQIRDMKDRPILRAAIANGADIIITGDRDFLKSGLASPKMITAAEFLQSQT
jgi:putative PIN family toxin of toxin-antitoxin system